MSHYLETINSPEDLNGLGTAQLQELCTEIREELMRVVPENGGHLSSNLGVVELTVALHKVFDSPRDAVIFDVGHQSYVHKLLTGRAPQFGTLRKEGGISGFPKPRESEHDPMIEGHLGTALSSAIGLARAKKLNFEDSKTIAVLGDGAFTNGMVYEAVNNIDSSLDNLIVILNDNRMSISKSVGSFAKYLLKLRTEKGYSNLKSRVEDLLNRIPVIGRPLVMLMARFKNFLRHALYGGVLFEELGFRYIGPVDGHDVGELVRLFENVKDTKGPMLIHCITDKGKGYKLAEENPGAYHGVGHFDIEKGNPDAAMADCFSNVFGKTLSEAAEKDKRICAVTAAMKYGTGLNFFAAEFKARFFDVDIAEEHAATFCAGLAKGGCKPVFAVYSTFLQRAFDQLYHDIKLNEADVMIAVDRAGIVGADGETHQGLMDPAIFGAIGGFTVVSPSNYDELRYWTEKLLKTSGPRAIRYPRGAEDPRIRDLSCTGQDTDLYEASGARTLIITYGREFAEVREAVLDLAAEDISCDIMKLNRILPLRAEDLEKASGYEHIIFAEEAVRSGGIGEQFLAALPDNGRNRSYEIVAADSCDLPQSSLQSALQRCGLDAGSLNRKVRDRIGCQ